MNNEPNHLDYQKFPSMVPTEVHKSIQYCTIQQVYGKYFEANLFNQIHFLINVGMNGSVSLTKPLGHTQNNQRKIATQTSGKGNSFLFKHDASNDDWKILVYIKEDSTKNVEKKRADYHINMVDKVVSIELTVEKCPKHYLELQAKENKYVQSTEKSRGIRRILHEVNNKPLTKLSSRILNIDTFNQPTIVSSMSLSTEPSAMPSSVPSPQPSREPSSMPSKEPTTKPSIEPSSKKNIEPSSKITIEPSTVPSIITNQETSREP